jgi:hypothetical protein
MGKILLYYKYVTIQYPKQVFKWQQKICKDLGLTGRILIGRRYKWYCWWFCEQTDIYKSIMQKVHYLQI